MKKTVSEAESVLTPTEVLRELFAETGEAGEAVIPVENYCDNFETLAPENATVTVKMRWTEADREEVAVRAGHLIDAFRLLADSTEITKDFPALKVAYEDYIEGFETGIVPEGENAPLGEAEEEKVLAAHRASHAADAARRVGEGPYAYAVLMRAGRLYRLFTLKAPRIILDHEAALFTQALALHSYAV